MERNEVVITGLGVISALGPNVESFTAGLRRGQSALGKLTLFDPSGCRSEKVGQAPEPTFPSALTLPMRTSRPDRFGIYAALSAVEQAGLSSDALRHGAVLFGTGCGGAEETESYLRQVLAGGHPASGGLVAHQPAAVTDLVARILGANGPRATIMTACSSSAIAISQARDLIALGHAEVAVCGGAEGLCRLTMAGFSALRATSKDLCRPFDAERTGLNLGEGAAALVLESPQHAKKRGARPLARLIGAGLSCDAYHMTAPHPQGAGALCAMQAACTDAGILPEAVGYINMHGTGTLHNDAAETAAVRQLFGDRSGQVPISSIKSMVGHTLGAAGAIEAIASVLSLCHGFLPPTANLENPDPAFGPPSHFDFIRGASREQAVDVVMSSSLAFGGNNAVLIFARA